MKSHTQVVVIGGGVVGCSVLYHLTKLGIKDAVLCERRQLTAGSSWHAAGGFHALNGDPNVAKLQLYTIRLYRELEALTGQDIGLHFTGGLNIAATPARWEFLRADWARHAVLGLKTELVGPEQIRDLCPLMETSSVLGAIYDPLEGHLDPYATTHAYARAAVIQGAEIYKNTRVTAIAPTGRESWHVVTEGGTIEAEHVVNAGGLWAREIGRMVGVEMPIVAMEHHYLLTEDLPQLKRRAREIPLVLDLDGEIYLRQERKGVLLGVYEKNATPWALDGMPWDYGENELLVPNLERLTEALSKGFERFPALAQAGIRKVVNGPFTFSPDGNPLVGPVPGVRNFWAACGVMAGFAQGGGVGLALAQWIARGEPEADIFAMDVARFGRFATRSYSIAKAREFYARRFQIAYPNEQWPGGRPVKTSPLYARHAEQRAVFGVSFGVEVPLYFSSTGTSEVPSLRRSNAFEDVRSECEAARNGVVLLDISSFAKYEVCGRNAEAALGKVLAGRLPKTGHIRVTPMLAPSGRLMGDLTTMRLADERFVIGGSGYLQSWHMRWFAEHLKDTMVRNITEEYGGLALIGPQSRALLTALTRADVSNAALPFMTVRELDIGFAPALVARLSVSGELGYELYVPALYLGALYEAAVSAGATLGARNVGYYALNSLRLEKGFGIWSREFSRDYTPRMARLERFIDYEREGFIGRDAVLADLTSIPSRRLVTLCVESREADASGYEPIYLGRKLVGFVTSGGYGHCTRTSLAMGYVDSLVPDNQTGLSVTVLGESCSCRILPMPLYDPAGIRMRN